MGAPHEVLVVDDDASLRLLCRVNLELDGHTVNEAATLDGARAVLSERADQVELVLLDVHVGAENGLTLLDELDRERPARVRGPPRGCEPSSTASARGCRSSCSRARAACPGTRAGRRGTCCRSRS